jgi:hypothetical protein
MTESTLGTKFAPGDVENGCESRRKMSRIGSIPEKSSSPDDSDNPDSYLESQKLAEKGNEIVYRSCSWQKVRLIFFFTPVEAL